MNEILTLNFDNEITGKDQQMKLILSYNEMNRIKNHYKKATRHDSIEYEFEKDFAELLLIFKAIIEPNISEDDNICFFGIGYMEKFLNKYFR